MSQKGFDLILKIAYYEGFFFLPSLIILFSSLFWFSFNLLQILSRVFLLIQLISIISFITWLDDCCHSEKYADKWYAFPSLNELYIWISYRSTAAN